jgi:hypothetical protein
VKYRYLFVVFAWLGLLLSPDAFAASKKKPPPPPTIQAPTIHAVTADSITVKDSAGTKTLTMTQFTEINVNGRRATAADLKPGMTVTVTLGTDATKASRINATGK